MRQVLPVRVRKIGIVKFGAETEGWDCKGKDCSLDRERLARIVRNRDGEEDFWVGF